MERVRINGLMDDWLEVGSADVRHSSGPIAELRMSGFDWGVHLTRAQATQLRDALTAFIEEGA